MSDPAERIRAELDLGDSAPAAKKLDEEIQRLTKDLRNLTEEFGQKGGDPKAFIDKQNAIRNEISATAAAVEKLKGGTGGAGIGLDDITRKMFAFERGASALASGTGLARAGGLLEAGIGLFGGPAGIGFALAMLANSLDNVLPKLEGFWAHLWNQVTADQVRDKLKELQEEGKKAKESLDAVLARPAPGAGNEAMQAHQAQALQELFNRDVEKNVGLRKGIEDVLRQRGLMGHWEESSEIQDLRRKQKDYRRFHESLETETTIQEAEQGFQKQIDKIINDNITRRADEFMTEAMQPGERGKHARKNLAELIRNHSVLFPRGALILQKLREADEDPFRPPTPEAIEQDKQARVEWAQRQMDRAGRASQRHDLAFIVESGGEEFVGPPAPGFAQRRRAELRLERQRRLEQRRTGLREGIAGPPRPPLDLRRLQGATPAHPEGFSTESQRAADRARAHVSRQVHVPFLPPALGQMSPQLLAAQPLLHETTGHHQTRMQEERNKALATPSIHNAMARMLATPYQKELFKLEDALHQLNDLRNMQDKALMMEQQGLQTHEKTQHVVAAQQAQIQNIWQRLQRVQQNADNLLRNQQRTNQNTTGPF